MRTKKKPAKKRTVTAWVWSVSDGTSTVVALANFGSDGKEQRMTDYLSGYRVGPLTKIEVPLE